MQLAASACVMFMSLSLPAANPPAIDGFLQDPFWSTGARVWHTFNPELAGHGGRFMVGFDNEFLYFAADIQDPDVTARRRHRQDDVYADDAVLFMIDLGDGTSTRRTPETFEYAISAAGGINWNRGRDTTEAGETTEPALTREWESQVRWAVMLKPRTTLNLGVDQDPGYQVEARIPWSELGQTSPIRRDRSIGLNLLAICRSTDKPAEYAMLSLSLIHI